MSFEIKRSVDGEIDFGETSIENVFIKQYMPQATDIQVKVYLLGLLLAQSAPNTSLTEMGQMLGVSERKIKAAIEYWERLDLIITERRGEDWTYSYSSIRTNLFAKVGKQSNVKERQLSSMINEIKGVPVNGEEFSVFQNFVDVHFNGMEILNATLRLFYRDKKVANFSVLRGFLQKLRDEEITDLEEVLIQGNRYIDNYSFYKGIRKMLGIRRELTEAEKTMIDSWISSYGIDGIEISKFIEEKSPKLRNPSIGYINTMLAEHYGDSEFYQKKAQYQEIKNAITGSGFALTDAESKLIDKWFTELRLSREKIDREIERLVPRHKGANVAWIDDALRGNESAPVSGNAKQPSYQSKNRALSEAEKTANKKKNIAPLMDEELMTMLKEKKEKLKK